MSNFCVLINFLLHLVDHSKLKINCYRALLEFLIYKHYPAFRRTELAKVRRFERLHFDEYVHLATRDLPFKFDQKYLNDELIRLKLDDFIQIIKFYSLRLYLAPIIENLIHIDRMLYLYENKIPSFLCPIFNPKLSPRNSILFAFK